MGLSGAWLAGAVSLVLAMSAAIAQPAATPPAANDWTQPASAQAAAWPRTVTRDGASVTIYQPQATGWTDRKRLTARAAIAVTPQGQGQGQDHPILGTVELSLITSADDAGGLVQLSDPVLLSSRFPALDTGAAAALDAKLRAALPQMQLRPVPLASVLLSLKQLPAPAVALDNDPPVIFASSRPASLVVFDGEPVLAPVGKTAGKTPARSGLSFAVNTNWDVFALNGAWYLLADGMWLTAPAATGPYAPVRRLPTAFNNLPHEPSFADARKHIPALAPAAGAQAPTIFVSTKPASIIVTAGPPRFAPIAGTGLQRVANTDCTLIFDPAQKRFYLLLSGRWFAAAGLDGPWTYATPSLPADFALIPPDGPDAGLLPAVPGTTAAQEAVLRAQIPVTAAVDRKTATITVAYVGAPRFDPIPGTALQHAVNTSKIVLRIGAAYYACKSGAWFVAASPTGPWALADSVPEAVKAIPPSSPLYPVTYVQVYGSTPAAVTYGYSSGYLLGFVSAGVLVYGTGYSYPPVVVPGPVPVYFPYPYTYAGNVWYNSATGAWARGGTVYGPYGAATAGRYYNPANGAWARGGAVYGPYGGAGAWSYYNPTTGGYAHGSAVWGGGSGTANASFYNPRTGVSASTNQNVNPYGRWGSSTISGPNQTVHTQSRSNAQGAAGSFSSSTGAQGAGYHNRATGSSGGVVKGAGGDVYAGRDGNVYKHTDTGWSKYGNGGWTPVQPANGGRVQGGANASASGANRGANQAANRGANRTAGHPASVDQGSYQQLEQDRLGRRAGQGWPSAGGNGGGGARRYRR